MTYRRNVDERPLNMNGSKSYQVAVIGSGAGGREAATHAARNGLRVALVESDGLGGTSFHRGYYSVRAFRACVEVARDRSKNLTGPDIRSSQTDLPDWVSAQARLSGRLARELQTLLLRFGIAARLRAVGNAYGHPQWTVDVTGVNDQRRFLHEIGAHGERGLAAIAAQQRLDAMTAAGRFDTIPSGVWERVEQVMKERSFTLHHIQVAVGSCSRGDLNADICPTRTRIGRIAQILDDAELEMLATNDVFWDTVASIQSIGHQPVYDATVLGTHNFVANGINIHNSIEQDSDVVILLHREDQYEKESPRAGEADLIVAKNRNGPTTTVTVAFQGHYSRFVDMAG